MTEPQLHPLAGSERRPMRGFRPAGVVDPQASVEVSVILRPGGPVPAGGSRREVADARRASDADAEAVVAYARSRGLEVLDVHHHRRTVVLRGPAAAMQAAFGVSLERWQGPGGVSHRGRVGALSLPAPLLDAVVAVLGLDDRPQARPHIRFRDGRGARRPQALPRGLTPPEVGALYDFPAGLDGSGVDAAVIELGGGFRPAELAAYFRELGVPAPHVVAVGVDGGVNAPGAEPDADGEVYLDVEVLGALAPGARQTVYFAPNTDRGFYDAISTAVHDGAHPAAVVSISWGGPEADWTLQAARAMDLLLADAAAMGVTVCASSGDSGAADGLDDGLLHATFPASSPSVLACGGTRLVAHGSSATETVWNDMAEGGGATGGGVSDLFALPAYQAGAGVPRSANPDRRAGRGLPDVAGDADPVTGFRIRVGGAETVIGGTSAVSPLWAALLARCTQALGAPLGLVHTRLYALPADAGALRDIVTGDNGGYTAHPGWDACTGLGTPRGRALLDALRGTSAGGAGGVRRGG